MTNQPSCTFRGGSALLTMDASMWRGKLEYFKLLRRRAGDRASAVELASLLHAGRCALL